MASLLAALLPSTEASTFAAKKATLLCSTVSVLTEPLRSLVRENAKPQRVVIKYRAAQQSLSFGCSTSNDVCISGDGIVANHFVVFKAALLGALAVKNTSDSLSVFLFDGTKKITVKPGHSRVLANGMFLAAGNTSTYAQRFRIYLHPNATYFTPPKLLNRRKQWCLAEDPQHVRDQYLRLRDVLQQLKFYIADHLIFVNDDKRVVVSECADDRGHINISAQTEQGLDWAQAEIAQGLGIKLQDAPRGQARLPAKAPPTQTHGTTGAASLQQPTAPTLPSRHNHPSRGQASQTPPPVKEGRPTTPSAHANRPQSSAQTHSAQATPTAQPLPLRPLHGPLPLVDSDHIRQIVNTSPREEVTELLVHLCKSSPALSGAVARGLAPHSTWAKATIDDYMGRVNQDGPRKRARYKGEDEDNEEEDDNKDDSGEEE